MIIGEAPGQHEDLQGEPFVGSAGKLLDQLLQGIGLRREEVYITNIIKCRPPGNRDPQADEVDACSPYLEEQIRLIDPEVVLVLGRHALARVLPGHESISRVHGRVLDKGGRAYIPVYHPAAALYNSFLMRSVEEDFSAVKRYLERGAPRPQPPDPAPVRVPDEQLTLFG